MCSQPKTTRCVNKSIYSCNNLGREAASYETLQGKWDSSFGMQVRNNRGKKVGNSEKQTLLLSTYFLLFSHRLHFWLSMQKMLLWAMVIFCKTLSGVWSVQHIQPTWWQIKTLCLLVEQCRIQKPRHFSESTVRLWVTQQCEQLPCQVLTVPAVFPPMMIHQGSSHTSSNRKHTHTLTFTVSRLIQSKVLIFLMLINFRL